MMIQQLRLGLPFCIVWAVTLSPALARADDLEMVDAFGSVVGTIRVTGGSLWVEQFSGERSKYDRDPRYDSPRRTHLGYYSFELNRVIRFPRSGYGMIERADLDSPVPIFSPASVTVRPIGSGGVPVGDAFGIGPVLSPGFPAPPLVNPLTTGPLIATGPMLAGPVIGGMGFGGVTSGFPINSGYGPVAPVQPAGIPVGAVLIDSRVVPGVPLPPVDVRLVNTQRDELIVTLSDLMDATQSRQIRLAPGQSQTVSVPRTSGGQRIQSYREFSGGIVAERSITIDLPPTPRFEVIVHRRQLQSIAIDRTGKSPNVIEDVNYQGRGVGRFPLLAGEPGQSTTIDVFAAATAAGNPGIVAPIVEP